jgi:hypothetical protein
MATLGTDSLTYVGDAPSDGTAWSRLNGAWARLAASTTLPLMDGTAAAGVATTYSRGDHVHPTDTSRAPIASPTFTGTVQAPTAAANDNSTAVATTAFVKAQNYMTGNQTITLTGDVTGSGTTSIVTTLAVIDGGVF